MRIRSTTGLRGVAPIPSKPRRARSLAPSGVRPTTRLQPLAACDKPNREARTFANASRLSYIEIQRRLTEWRLSLMDVTIAFARRFLLASLYLTCFCGSPSFSAAAAAARLFLPTNGVALSQFPSYNRLSRSVPVEFDRQSQCR